MNARRNISGRDYAYSIEDHLLQAGDAAYQYDADGFLTSKRVNNQTTLYKYSSRGELLRVDLPDGRVIEYTNDPRGRRIAKKINGSIIEKYLWRSRTKLLAVFDGNDNLLYRYEYAGSRLPVAVSTGGQKYYQHYDQVGTLRSVTDAAGAVVKEATYDSFGNVLSDSRPTMSHFAFAGGLYDADTGLVRFGYRDYDANVGVWTAKDPIKFKGNTISLYLYANGNPIQFIDSLGLMYATGKMKECLDRIFRESSHGAEVIEDKEFVEAHGSLVDATTRRGQIFVKSLAAFWSDRQLVLHEYYHVLRQWNQGAMDTWDYIVEILQNGYSGSKYEIAAEAFAKEHLAKFNKCLNEKDGATSCSSW